MEFFELAELVNKHGPIVALLIFLTFSMVGILWLLIKNGQKLNAIQGKRDNDREKELFDYIKEQQAGLREVLQSATTSIAQSAERSVAIKDQLLVMSDAVKGVGTTLNNFSIREDERHKTNEERAAIQMKMWNEITEQLGDIRQKVQVHESMKRLAGQKKKAVSVADDMVPA